MKLRSNRYHWIETQFSKVAKGLRQEFDQKFNDPRHSHVDRFVWDHWVIPEQYRLLRTPAEDFFSKRHWQLLVDELRTYGLEKFGCSEISKPWLSYYVDGCFQEFHTDDPHGPFAFVYSLTDWSKREFGGGRTKILRQNTLQYWQRPHRERGFELNDLVQFVEPKFNQLLVFDPRFPHGVERVERVQDPRKGRLVVHGWFTEPRPHLQGRVSQARVKKVLHGDFKSKISEAAVMVKGHGYLAFRIISRGKRKKVEVVVNTLMNNQTYVNQAIENRKLEHECVEKIMACSWPVGNYDFTLPMRFQ